jgi:hypothetical protein
MMEAFDGSYLSCGTRSLLAEQCAVNNTLNFGRPIADNVWAEALFHRNCRRYRKGFSQLKNPASQPGS